MLVRTKNVSYEQKNLWSNKKIFCEECLFVKCLQMFGKNENFLKEDLEILFMTKTMV